MLERTPAAAIEDRTGGLDAIGAGNEDLDDAAALVDTRAVDLDSHRLAGQRAADVESLLTGFRFEDGDAVV